jgi:hypothetical protein
LSLETCQHLAIRLPDNQSCGGLCEIFAKCLGQPSPQLLAAVVQLRIDAMSEQENHLATAEALALIHEALLAGLEKNDDADG